MLITIFVLLVVSGVFCGPAAADYTLIYNAQGLSDALNATISGNASYVDADGKVVLYKNITLPQSLILYTFGEELILTTTSDASHTISRGYSDQLFDIQGDSKFILEGSGENFIILDGNSSFYPDCGSPLIYGLLGTVELRNGSILQNNHATFGGGVLVVDCDLTISGGIIQDNAASLKGGGIHLERGMVHFTSGSISRNIAGNIGGGVDIQSGEVYVTSGSISDNFATSNGGGVNVESGIFSLSSGTISGNSAGNNGGGVFINDGNSDPVNVDLSGGTINQNSAALLGNDVYYSGIQQKVMSLSDDAHVNDMYILFGSINISHPFTRNGGIDHLFIESAEAGKIFAHLDYYSDPSDIFDFTAVRLNSTQDLAYRISQSDDDLYLLKNISALSIGYTQNLTYTGNEQVLSVNVYDAGYLLIDNGDYVISGTAGTSAGDYYFTIQGVGNYFGTSAHAWSIERAAPTVNDLNFSLDSVTYDGSVHSVSVTPNASVLGLGSLTVLYNSSPDAPVSAGDYITTVSINEGVNYTSADLVLGSFSIGKAAPTLDNLTFSLAPVMYDGSAHPVSVTPNASVLGLGSLTVLYNFSPEAPVSAGAYEISVQISEGVNYTSADLELGSFSIGKAAPSESDLTFSLDSVTYDGSVHSVSVTPNVSVLGLGSLTVLYNSSPDAPVSAGDYITAVSISEGVNYTSADLVLGSFVISPYIPPSDDDDDDEDYARPTQTSSANVVNASSTPSSTLTMDLISAPASTPAVKATLIPAPVSSESNESFPPIWVPVGIALGIFAVIGGSVLFVLILRV